MYIYIYVCLVRKNLTRPPTRFFFVVEKLGILSHKIIYTAFVGWDDVLPGIMLCPDIVLIFSILTQGPC